MFTGHRMVDTASSMQKSRFGSTPRCHSLNQARSAWIRSRPAPLP
jgi:hypothetical protein